MTAIRTILSCGNNRIYAQIARRCGCGVGARLPATVERPLEFADCDWKRFDVTRWIRAIQSIRPQTAVLPDMEDAPSIRRALDLIEFAATYTAEAVILVPKSIEALVAIATLPERVGKAEIWLGFSVPSRYGATTLPVWAFTKSFLGRTRPIHLLGGTPQQQVELARYLPVRQVDGTAVVSAAKKGSVFDGRQWRQTPRRQFSIEQILEQSLNAWRAALN